MQVLQLQMMLTNALTMERRSELNNNVCEQNIYNQALPMQKVLNLMVYQLLHQMVLLLVMIMQTMVRQLPM